MPVTEKSTFFPPNQREAVSRVYFSPVLDCGKNPKSLLCLRKKLTNNKLSCFRLLPVENTEDGVRFNVKSSKKQQLGSFRRDVHAPMLSLSSENTRADGFGRHFVFYPRWGSRICSNTHQHSKDEGLSFKHISLLPPVPNPACSVNRMESPFATSKSCTLMRIKTNLSTLKSTIIDHSFADPVLGASASFIQRLLEMSTLQEKTIHQEKLKEVKKNRRHEL